MPDLQQLGQKLLRYREQLQLSPEEVAGSTGLTADLINRIEAGLIGATGDQLLILADRYRCDYKYFLSNERLAPFEQTESLYRMYESALSREDRWVIQDLLYLCDNEAYLQKALNRQFVSLPSYQPKGSYFKGQGRDAAGHVRQALGIKQNEVPLDPFHEFRRLGIHIFRRKLSNSSVSGIFIKHPTAGPCVLVNFDEDRFRQRFTLSHEVGHAVLDSESEEPSVSFMNQGSDLREVRANAFAGAFLIPDQILGDINISTLTLDSFSALCTRLMVNTQTLMIALKERGNASEEQLERFKGLRVPKTDKPDPELGPDLTEKSRERRQWLLHRGLSFSHIRLCFDAHREGIISLLRLSECLLLDLPETLALLNSFSEGPNYRD